MLRIFLFVLILLMPKAAFAQPAYFLEILFDGVPVEGGGWVLTVTLEALDDLAHAELILSTSDGLRINAGDPQWSGPLEAGEEEVMELALTLTGPRPQSAFVRLRGRTAAGVAFEERVEKPIAAD